HAGRGSYDLSSPSAEAAAGIGRFASLEPSAPELRQYAALLTQFRARRGQRHLYPGSPLIAASELRPQDRALLTAFRGPEARAGAGAGVRAVAVPARLAGRAQRLGPADRKPALPHARAPAGLAAGARVGTGRGALRGRECADAVTIPLMGSALDQYGVVGHPVGHSLSPFIHGMFARE